MTDSVNVPDINSGAKFLLFIVLIFLLPHAAAAGDEYDELMWNSYRARDFEQMDILYVQSHDDFKWARSPEKYLPDLESLNFAAGSDSYLYDAIHKRDFEMVKFLLDRQYSQTYYPIPYRGGGTVYSCLKPSIENNDADMLRFLLENGVKKNIGTVMNFWVDDVSYAITKTVRADIIKVLIEFGYDINKYIGYKGQINPYETYLAKAVRSDFFEAAEAFLEAGADPNDLVLYSNDSLKAPRYSTILNNEGGYTESQSKEMRDLLIRYGAKTLSEFTWDDFSEHGVSVLCSINNTRVRYRDSPSLSGQHLGYFDLDEEVEVIAATADSMPIGNMNSPWCLVRRDDDPPVWVYGHFVSLFPSGP